MKGFEVNNSLFRKTIVIYLLFVVFYAAVTSAFCMISINKLRSDQLKLTYEITGKLAGAYPDKKEDIALSVLGATDRQAYDLGREVLQKYGYDSKLNVLDD